MLIKKDILIYKNVTFLFLAFLMALMQAQAQDTYIHHNLEGAEVDIALWHADYQDICFAKHESVYNSTIEQSPEQKELELLLEKLEFSEIGRFLIAKAESLGTLLCLDATKNGILAYFDEDLNLVMIKTDLMWQQQLLFLVHELRHLDQVSRGFCTSLNYGVKEIARLRLATEADAQTIATLAAWQLNQSNFTSVWSVLLESEQYADMALVFEASVGQGDDLKQSLLLTFEQWYQSDWRPSSYYLSSCMQYFDTLNEGKRVEHNELLPKAFFNNLCLLPDGSSYDCHLSHNLYNFIE